MFLVPINYVALVVCAAAAMGLGFLWYGPLFGKEWMKLMGMAGKKMDANKKMGKTYTISFLLELLTAYVLAHIIWYSGALGAHSMTNGIKTGVWVWLGFVATTMATGYLFAAAKKPVKLFIIDSGYQLVTLIVMSTVIVGMGV